MLFDKSREILKLGLTCFSFWKLDLENWNSLTWYKHCLTFSCHSLKLHFILETRLFNLVSCYLLVYIGLSSLCFRFDFHQLIQSFIICLLSLYTSFNLSLLLVQLSVHSIGFIKLRISFDFKHFFLSIKLRAVGITPTKFCFYWITWHFIIFLLCWAWFGLIFYSYFLFGYINLVLEILWMKNRIPFKTAIKFLKVIINNWFTIYWNFCAKFIVIMVIIGLCHTVAWYVFYFYVSIFDPITFTNRWSLKFS